MDGVQGGSITSPRKPKPEPEPEPDAGKRRNNQPRRRNRPALSCIQCRSRKIRCNREEPCHSCQKSKIVNCSYEESRRPKPRLWKLSPGPSSDSSVTPGHAGPSGPGPGSKEGPGPFVLDRVCRNGGPYSTASGVACANSTNSLTCGTVSGVASVSNPIGHDVEIDHAGSNSTVTGLLGRVQQLEQQLADALKSRASYSCTASPSIPDGLVSRPAQFGTDHWVDGEQFPMLSDVANRFAACESSTQAHVLLQQYQGLARAFKESSKPKVPTLTVGKNIPSEDTCNRLLNAYFRTFEGVFRILHEPTFLQSYREYWDKPAHAEPTFILQLKLCMAIGACFQDDVVELRRLAIDWIFETEIWLVSPSGKSRLNLAALQIMCLLHLARETCGVGGDLGWTTGGAILRCAMRMKLHRDPDWFPKMSSLSAELRRRLWATVMEFELQCSMGASEPPLISPSDYDTHPPSNYDDDQLSDDPSVVPVPRPSSAFTQTSVQLALLQSLPARVGITEYLHKLKSNVSYEATVGWNTELSVACQALTATLKPLYDPAGVLPKRLSLFQLRLAEHTVHRFFLAVNHPWLVPSQNNSAYYFSRKMCVETALKLTRCLSCHSTATNPRSSQQGDDFTRLSTCGSWNVKSILLQCVATIALELFWQVQEDRSPRKRMDIDSRLGGEQSGEVEASAARGVDSAVASQAELHEALKLCVLWHEQCMRAGDTYVKNYCFITAFLTQIEAMQRGANESETAKALEASLNDALSHAFGVLEELHGANKTSLDYPEWDRGDVDEFRVGTDVNKVLGDRWNCD